jgi:NAD(P)-dependent dehydrogenase (short-subunit alcohol dehydrogenase family)
VTKWDELVQAFVAAVEFAPHKGLDIVCPNAGIVGPQLISQWPGEKGAHPTIGTIICGLTKLSKTVPTAPASLHSPPPRASLKNLEVNLLAVAHCVHLALHYFKLPSSTPKQDEYGSKAIILTGSIVSYLDSPGAELYGAGKSGVRGLFKALREGAPGVRICMVAPT